MADLFRMTDKKADADRLYLKAARSFYRYGFPGLFYGFDRRTWPIAGCTKGSPDNTQAEATFMA